MVSLSPEPRVGARPPPPDLNDGASSADESSGSFADLLTDGEESVDLPPLGPRRFRLCAPPSAMDEVLDALSGTARFGSTMQPFAGMWLSMRRRRAVAAGQAHRPVNMEAFLLSDNPSVERVSIALRQDPNMSAAEFRRLIPAYLIRALLTNPQIIPESFWSLQIRLRLAELAFLEEEFRDLIRGWSGLGLVEHRHRLNRLGSLLLMGQDFYRRAGRGPGRSEEAVVGIRALMTNLETLLTAIRADGMIFF